MTSRHRARAIIREPNMLLEQAIKERDAALRDSQLDLFHSLQVCLDEAAREMLGNKDWSTDKVDRELRELMDELNDHFGIEGSTES